jgi:hypothetical protein
MSTQPIRASHSKSTLNHLAALPLPHSNLKSHIPHNLPHTTPAHSPATHQPQPQPPKQFFHLTKTALRCISPKCPRHLPNPTPLPLLHSVAFRCIPSFQGRPKAAPMPRRVAPPKLHKSLSQKKLPIWPHPAPPPSTPPQPPNATNPLSPPPANLNRHNNLQLFTHQTAKSTPLSNR